MSSRAYRIAPRSRTRRRSRLHWDRVGRVALVLVLFVILALYVNPLVNFIDAYRDSKAETAQLAELTRENERLRARAATPPEPDAAERGARKLGMVAAGEGSAIVKGLGD